MKYVVLLLILALFTPVGAAPNLVFIFIDDMGYGDIGPFGNTVNQTPNLDRMAAEGNVLRHFYVSNTACTPSRSALMTGTYASRIGMDGMVTFPGDRRGLNPGEITIAEMLKARGYATGCFGKWHLGDQPPFLPTKQGFDEYFGIPYSNDMWPGNQRGNPLTKRGPYTPLPVIRQDEPVAYVSDGPDQALLAEVITAEAVTFIKKHKDESFFLYVPHAYVHNPRFARPAILEKANGNVNRANIEEVDTSVGRILDTLRELKLDRKTLVIFTSDNGGAGGMSMGPLRGGKGGPKYEGHMRVPTISWWPGKIAPGTVTDEIATTVDILPSLAKLTGAAVPKDRKIDGKDALDVLLGKPGATSPHEILFYEGDGIRRGKWKLVRAGRGRTELYDLDTDPGERRNLARQRPQLAKELGALLTKHAADIRKVIRPPGIVQDPKPIISQPGDLPRLRTLMNLADPHVPTPAPAKKPKRRQQAAAPRPNILIIFTDDQGYADLGCFGSKTNKTPRLDQLAKEGTRFTSFYSQTVCGPSRSALLTGRHPIRSKGWGMPASEITFAELMKKAGYQTACIGKWDVSNRKAIIERMPNAQGFDYYFGTLGANDGGGVAFHQNNDKAGSTRDMGSLTKLYTDKAISYLQEHRDPKKPFALYLAHTMMHTIIDASGRFRGKSAGGLYGDVVEEFDYETGRLLDTLDELGLSSNTLVIYTSDNGPWNQDKYTKRKKGHPEGSIFWGDAGPLRNGKGSPYEGGYRLPCIVRWPGKVPAGRVSGAIFATIDFMPTFANLAGFDVPDDRRIDGIDQADLLLGKKRIGRDHFYFQGAGVRLGKWKYLKANAHFHGYAVEDDRRKTAELYNLETDLGERMNLAEQFPDKAAQLQALMQSIEAGDRLDPSDNRR